MPYWVSLTLKGGTQTACFQSRNPLKHFSDEHSFSPSDLKRTGREEDETEWIVGSRGNVNEVNIEGGKKHPSPTY